MKKKKSNKIEITEVANFGFCYKENAERVALSLSAGGYLTRIIRSSDINYRVIVFSDRE